TSVLQSRTTLNTPNQPYSLMESSARIQSLSKLKISSSRG
ncbi:hypothetical protein CMV_028517, partial [Castanea mollissima]